MATDHNINLLQAPCKRADLGFYCYQWKDYSSENLAGSPDDAISRPRSPAVIRLLASNKRQTWNIEEKMTLTRFLKDFQ